MVETAAATAANTKERILQTALNLFAKRGFSAVSVRDITDGLSMTKGALYRHYTGKQGILDSIVERMEKLDLYMAQKYEAPLCEYRKSPEQYAQMPYSKLRAYTEAMFDLWTSDPFASSFRRLLTLEQYGSDDMRTLYQRFFTSGPTGYTADIFREKADARRLALEFFAPVYLLYSIYDDAEDKEEVKAMLQEHLERFERLLE